MLYKNLFNCFSAIIVTVSNLIFLPSAHAQVSSDGTLPTNVTESGNVYEINGGATEGSNLFHSFEDFSVPNGFEAFFNNTNNISNIFSRVTGGNISNIDGLIRANGSANLFLINPAGILFGSGARLDIGGSFYGSTADSILFPNGIEFSAVNIESPILTINAPIGLNLRDNPEEIVNRSFVLNSLGNDFVGLEVQPGKTLGLLGGNINFEMGQATASGGRINLGGLSEAGTITLNDDGSFSFPENVARADIILSNLSNLDVMGTGGGRIAIDGRNISLFDITTIRAGIIANLTSAEATIGDITINASDNLIVDESFISNSVELGAVGNTGAVEINTTNLTLINGGQIGSAIFGEGNAGNVTVNAKDTISVDGESSLGIGSIIGSSIQPNAVGNAGVVRIDTTNLSLTNGGQIQSAIFGEGNGGTVTVNAKDTISVDGEGINGFPTAIGSNIDSNAIGNAGVVRINTSNLNLTNGGQIFSGTLGQGNGGTVTVNAKDTISVDGEGRNGFSSTISSLVGIDAIGNAGEVIIDTSNLNLTNGGQISNSIFGAGDLGTVTVNAKDTISIDGEGTNGLSSGITNNIVPNAISTGEEVGEVKVEATNLILSNGGQIGSNNFGEGNAGIVTVDVEDTISVDGEGTNGFFSGIASIVGTGAVGKAGTVIIDTNILSVTNGGQIGSSTLGRGNAGTVNVIVKDTIFLDGANRNGFPSSISSLVAEDAIGDAGEVIIDTANLTLTNGGQISSSNLNQGESGNVTIKANSLNLDNGLISASTVSGIERGNIFLQVAETLILEQNSLINAEAIEDANGGNINIDAKLIIAFPSSVDGSDIIASSEQGIGGNININAQALLGIEEGQATKRNRTNDIDASSEFGLDGNVTFIIPDTNNFSETANLSSDIISAEVISTTACSSDDIGEDTNTFLVTSEGLRPLPNAPVNGEILLNKGEPINIDTLDFNQPQTTQNNSTEIQPIKTVQGEIYPARGVIVKEDGTVTLTAYATNTESQRIFHKSGDCNDISEHKITDN